MTFRNSILAGVTLIREAIQSQNYVAGSEGWTINADGTAEFSDLTIRSSDGSGNTVIIANGVITIKNSSGDTVSTISQDGYKVWDPTGTDLLAEVTLSGGTNSDPGFIARYESYPHIYSFLGNGELQWLNEDTNMHIEPTVSMQSLAVEDDDIGMTLIPGCYTNTANVPRIQLQSKPSGTDSVISLNSRAGNDPDIELDGSVTTLGIPVRGHQSGTELVTFVTQSSFTQAVVFDVEFPSTPIVTTEIQSGAGVTARWGSRAISVTTTGFTLFVFEGDAADPAQSWTDVPVVWSATLPTQ